MTPLESLAHGAMFPWEEIRLEEFNGPTKSDDWAHAAARGIFADLSLRDGVGHSLEYIDPGDRAEVLNAVAAIIREAESRRGEYGQV